uniref:GxGYxYP putative glycoside hydrolase C-terminal domain-containing protein n=1 Tax=Mucochytrium quahogii TaxID=96639 RepID=A0A7S2RRB6_9STRA|mmetsp:Transcript_17252/g.27885  ORF Transcript_17252/g.27885 Transcript_17252/m.27885 type:complete len:549 (-) Transcript_17252:65-1711(-)
MRGALAFSVICWWANVFGQPVVERGSFVVDEDVLGSAPAGKDKLVIDLRGQKDELIFAAQVGAGLRNRESAQSVYTYSNDDDVFWKNELLSKETFQTKSMGDFVKEVVKQYGVILYDSKAVDAIPAVVTVAAVRGYIPIAYSVYNDYKNASVKVNFTHTDVNDAFSATLPFLNETSTLAIQTGARLLHGQLVDYIVYKKMFTTYLEKGCIPFTTQRKLFKDLIKAAHWPRPIKVFGYNNQFPVFGGDVFEAETDCANELGQIATSATTNLGYWSADAKPGLQMVQKKYEHIVYDKEKAYVAIVYGDMDNINFVETFGKAHMLNRSKSCAENKGACFPLTWTLSPNLLDFAPRILEWYYEKAKLSGNDWFIFPPSGTLYAYPGIFPDHIQKTYVEQMDTAAKIMNTSGSVHWEWIFTWKQAFQNYFPRYTQGNVHTIKSFFLNNVPWVFPIVDMTIHRETYRIFGEDVVVFKPAFNWAYTNPSGGKNLTGVECAKRIGKFSKGSINYVYTIQTTDANVLFEMAKNLPKHVQLVSYEQLASLALQKSKHK